MKRTNILVEVSDSIYDNVVSPHKKAKTFSKLIASLLTGYVENEYIRAYAEDTLDDMHKASVDALDEVIGNMQQSLSNMGLYTGELKENNESGMSYFSEKNQPLRSNNDGEVEELRDSVEELKNQNAEIMSMLREFMESASTGKVAVEDKQNVKPKEITRVEEKPVRVVEPVKVIEPVKVVEAVKVVEDEPPALKEVKTTNSGINGNDLLASLTQGNTFKF